VNVGQYHGDIAPHDGHVLAKPEFTFFSRLRPLPLLQKPARPSSHALANTTALVGSASLNKIPSTPLTSGISAYRRTSKALAPSLRKGAREDANGLRIRPGPTGEPYGIGDVARVAV
jgi:hypothetical protein